MSVNLLQPLQDRLEDLRAEAEHLRNAYGDGERASALEHAVDEIEVALAELCEQEVNYRTAADLEDVAEGTVRNWVAEGKLTNVGTQGDGRIPVAELKVGALLEPLAGDSDRSGDDG